jgi:hypothetical protein
MDRFHASPEHQEHVKRYPLNHENRTHTTTAPDGSQRHILDLPHTEGSFEERTAKIGEFLKQHGLHSEPKTEPVSPDHMDAIRKAMGEPPSDRLRTAQGAHKVTTPPSGPSEPEPNLSDIAARIDAKLAGSKTSATSQAPAPAKPVPWKRSLPPEAPLPMGEDTAAVTPSDFSYGNSDGTEDDTGAFLDDGEDSETVNGVPASAASYIKPQAPADDEIDEVVRYYASRNPALSEIVGHFRTFVTESLELAGMVNDYSRSQMAKDMIVKEPFDGKKIELMRDRLKRCAETYRIDPEKLFHVIEAYSDPNLNPTPEEDIPPAEYTIGLEPTSTPVIINPELNQGGGAFDGFDHEPDAREAARRHLRKRVHAQRFLRAAAALNTQETDFEIPDHELEDHCRRNGIDVSGGEWERILDLRRKKIRDLNSDSIMSSSGSSGNDNVNNQAYSGAS